MVLCELSDCDCRTAVRGTSEVLNIRAEWPSDPVSDVHVWVSVPFSLQSTKSSSAAQCFSSVSTCVISLTSLLRMVSPCSGLSTTSLRGGRIWPITAQRGQMTQISTHVRRCFMMKPVQGKFFQSAGDYSTALFISFFLETTLFTVWNGCKLINLLIRTLENIFIRYLHHTNQISVQSKGTCCHGNRGRGLVSIHMLKFGLLFYGNQSVDLFLSYF